MCGITGIYHKNSLPNKEDIYLMNRALSHRGPDAEGYYIDNDIALGHKRLSIIDLTCEANQPMTSHCGNYIIVYNGEVFNFKEIQQTLNISSKTKSDTEIILEAFVKEGVDFVNRLNGMFAIAIYNKVNQTLYLFRDRIGIKPLFFYNDSNILAFASEIKSLMQLKQVNQNVNLNKQAIPSYLFLGFPPSNQTFYDNISKLMPAHYAIVNKKEIQIKKYWDIKDKIISPNNYKDFQTSKNELKQLIEEAVKYRLIADVPLGTFLSGGIDSSLITAIASKYSNQKLKTFSIGFKESEYNESAYAKDVANYLKTEHYEYIVSENTILEYIDIIDDIYDEPFPDSSSFPTIIISKLAKQEVTTILSGEGGDELFYGYGSYVWANRFENKLLKAFAPCLSGLFNIINNRYQRVGKLLDYQNEANLNQHIFSQEQYYFSIPEINKLLTNEHRQALSNFIDNQIIETNLSLLEKQSLFEIQNYLPNDLLVKYDRATMFSSLEGRVPLLDYRVVEYAVNINPSFKLKNNISKFILKEILYDYIPKELFERPKWGFSIPLKYWLNSKLKFLIDENLNKPVIEQYNIVSYSYIKALVKDYQTGKTYLYNRIWLLILLHKWLRKQNFQ